MHLQLTLSPITLTQHIFHLLQFRDYPQAFCLPRPWSPGKEVGHPQSAPPAFHTGGGFSPSTKSGWAHGSNWCRKETLHSQRTLPSPRTRQGCRSEGKNAGISELLSCANPFGAPCKKVNWPTQRAV